jgi:nondiscriminating aspartyl-tRNA synthetase
MRTLAIEVAGRAGERVTLEGWVHNVRDHGGIAFVHLRDRSGVVQTIVSRKLLPEGGLPVESVVRLEGAARKEQRATGGAEVHVEALEILSLADPALPIEIGRQRPQEPSLDVLLNHRPLSLRDPRRSAVFRIQAAILEAFASALRIRGFTEVKSSKLVGSGTEGGTNLFFVDYFGRSAFLAQSPQFYKQMLVGVFERVFEAGPVFRAEPHNTSRHLNEYTSLDFEMGFIQSEEDVMDLEQLVLAHIFGELALVCERELDLFGASVPEVLAPEVRRIPRLRLDEAGRLLVARFGARERLFQDLSPAEERQLCQWAHEEHGSELLFITRYPVEKRPMYTMPEPQEPHLTRSFDLLFRGLEITTGGQRIHQYAQLVQSIQRFGLDPAGFESYLECFRYGMPPHGGLAIGLERLTMQLLGLPNVREACLFPRDRERLKP